MITSLINFDVDERREVHVSMLTRDMYITLTISLSITNREHFGQSTLVITEVSIKELKQKKNAQGKWLTSIYGENRLVAAVEGRNTEVGRPHSTSNF